MLNSPVIILGAPRSGTTLLRLILNAHSRIRIPNECHFFGCLHSKFGSFDFRANHVLDDFTECLSSFPNFKDSWGDSASFALRRLRESCVKDYFSAASIVYQSFGPQPSHDITPMWGDKSIGSVFYANLFSVGFPDSRFIHIVRDGRDSVGSILNRMNFYRPPCSKRNYWIKDPIGGSRLWNDFNEEAISVGLSVGESRYCVVRYEDLVQNPHQKIDVLCKFLGIEFEEAMLHPETPVRSCPAGTATVSRSRWIDDWSKPWKRWPPRRSR